MTPLYEDTEFERKSQHDYLPLQCEYCEQTFYKKKKYIKDALNPDNKTTGRFCSLTCVGKYNNKKEKIACTNCGVEFHKKKDEIKRTKNHFCSISCSTTYNNKHNKSGTRRSKLEAWLEEKLTELYPDFDIKFNDCEAIGSELDIYIPSLNLAFEINGIVHYQPIFGQDKFQSIQENDQNKYKACLDNEIDFCIIDASGLKYFKERNTQKYLKMITDIIDGRL